MARVPAAVRRVITIGLAAALFLTLAGTTYQGVATALERRRFPHPGRLVDVGGHQLHIYCTGEGLPTVVLEAPAASLSASWARVQQEVERRTRVCSYDRAGLGWSEAGDRPFSVSRVPDELRQLLDGAQERGPFVIVGRGLGAAYAKTFAARYADRTAALVLVDPPNEASGLNEGSLARITRATPWVARIGMRRVLRQANQPASGLPEPGAGAMRTFLYRPDHLSRSAAEVAAWREAVRLAESSQPAAPTSIVEGDAAAVAGAIAAAMSQAK